MLGPSHLVLCAGTLPASGLRERIRAASAAGFQGLSLFVDDYLQARAAGLSDADLRALLDDHGVAIAELDPLLTWVPEAGAGGGVTEEGAGFLRHREDDFYRVADALGARSLNAVLAADVPLSTHDLAGAFAGLCDRAAEHGLLVHLEFLPWTAIGDVDAALEIVELADRPNGGVMLDTWHHFRSRVEPDRLRRVPGARLLGVQLSDAPRRAEADPVDETLHRRLLPGDGDADLPGLLNTLHQIGAPAPLGVEVFSDVLQGLALDEAARRAGDAARAVLEKARAAR